jgi:pyruvate/2-oxoglutarate dehydrogenase complex dihydrolipoamide acyltransferase (E2) component
MATIQILMPKLGHLQEAGAVVEWMRGPGEVFKEGEILMIVETEKTQVEVAATFDGRMTRILVDTAVPVPVNTPIAECEAA